MGIFRQFPYSNFHEMNIDEIIKVVKDMLEEWAQYHAQWDQWQGDIDQAWQDMQDFINNYFDNLDVQQEINNKIISMVNSGEFADIVSPYIPDEVTTWLAANITQPVGVVIDTSLTVAGACADAKATGDAINDLSTALTDEFQGAIDVCRKNYVEGFYLSRTGTLEADENYCVSPKIPICFNSASFFYGTDYDSVLKINLCSYTADGTLVNFWGPLNGYAERAISDFGTNAAYIRFSYCKGYANAHLGSATGSIDNWIFWKPVNNFVGNVKNSVVGGSPNTIVTTSVGNNSLTRLCHNSLRSPTIFCYAKFNVFSAIEIGHGQTGTYTQYFRIDATNVTFYTHGEQGSSIAHGLTMDEYIGIVIDVNYDNSYKITINTLNGTWTREMNYPNVWQGNRGETFVKNSLSTITYLSLGYVGEYQFNKWMFGDSYLSNYSDDRWPYYFSVYDMEYTMLNAYPGEDSKDAYIDWIDALQRGTPAYAIWCLGMNDGDVGAINANWLAVVQMFISDCEERGITPILATIPNVPTINNTYKNAWVKASGYRYIDFAEAVGAETAGSTWYDGCLETGAIRVHPTTDGARLLFMRALLDFPEFAQK